MSRIFDALRQSEKDREPGADRVLPPALTQPGAAASAGAQPASESAPAAQMLLPVPAPAPGSEAVFVHPQPPAPAVDEELAGLLRKASETKGMPDFSVPRVLEHDLPPLPEEERIDLSKLQKVSGSSGSLRLVALSSERGLGAEKFRVLGARLSNIRLNQRLRILQVTSSVVGEGKTLTSVNLAMTLAKRFDQKVLLAEGDLRKPAVCEMLGLSNKEGIGEWWNEPQRPITDFLLRIGETGMCLLPAGDVAHPASVLQSARIAELFQGLASQFDWVIIDTPPLLPMADSNLWSGLSDGTLLVVRKGTVSRSALKKAVESLDNPKLVGVVLNDATNYDRVSYYDQYYTPRGDKPGEMVRQ
jgi:capsular exopolysaccharide synthesis family protein